jgi:hypothetical protein
MENKINKDKNIRAREVDGEGSDCDGDAVYNERHTTKMACRHPANYARRAGASIH